MKVKELIRQLKKLDPDAEVISQDHDQSEDEVSGIISRAEQSDSQVLQERFGGSVVVLM